MLKLLAEAFISTWAMIRICRLTTTNIMTLLLFMCFFFLYRQWENAFVAAGRMQKQKYVRISLAALLTFFYIFGSFEQIYAGLDNLLFRVIILAVTTAGLYVILHHFLGMIFLGSQNLSADDLPVEWNYSGWVTFLACMLGWTPYLLKNFPGIMTIDSMNQFAQVVGVYADSNHHPWVHTQIIKLFYGIGRLFTDNISLAVSFYTIFQMCFLGIIIAYLIKTLVQFGISKWVVISIIGFYALMPYQAIYAVTVWKDSMFVGSVLLFTTVLLRLLKKRDWDWNPKESWMEICLYLLAGIMLCLFRTNGWYAFLLTTPVLLWVLRRHFKTMLPLQILIIAVVVVVKGPVMNANGVIQPDLVEYLSIPAQQISRVIVEQKPLTKEQDAFLNRILDTSKIETLYNPYVSDGFKRLVRAGDQTYLKEHFGQFMKIYLQIGLEYPADYLIAFRDQSIGYWFPSQEGLIAADEGVIENEFGVTNMPVLKGPMVIKVNEILLKLKDIIPGYGILWSMGALFWLILTAMGILCTRQDKRLLLLYLPCIAIFLTLVIATPVAKEFRYAYAYIYVLPLYLTLPFLYKESQLL